MPEIIKQIDNTAINSPFSETKKGVRMIELFTKMRLPITKIKKPINNLFSETFVGMTMF
jgi:hypothetical protein